MEARPRARVWQSRAANNVPLQHTLANADVFVAQRNTSWCSVGAFASTTQKTVAGGFLANFSHTHIKCCACRVETNKCPRSVQARLRIGRSIVDLLWSRQSD